MRLKNPFPKKIRDAKKRFANQLEKEQEHTFDKASLRKNELWLPTIQNKTPLSHRPKEGANFAWGQQSGAWGRAGNANLLRVKATLLGVCLG